MLRDLSLSQFRCFERLDFAPGPRRSFIVGPNARGKTTILEAVCVLLRLQSPRTSTLADTVQAGAPGFGLAGHFADSHLTCHWQDGVRRITLDSKPQTRSDDYLDTARVAWFANSDLELVRGSGSPRRRFLDFLGAQCLPGYRTSLRAYERAVRSRNALLRDGRPRREIAAFDEPLCEAGDRLMDFRRSLCRDLAPLALTACAEISDGADTFGLTYCPGADGPMAVALAAARPDEDRLRQTTVGPHRDNLSLTINGMSASAFASEGQQRGIAISLKLAQARHLEHHRSAPPLYLIDDVFGELDRGRRNRLLAALPASAQALITTTFLDWAGNTGDDDVFQIEDGRLSSPR